MSWTLTITGDALPSFRALETWLQEEVLDELDALCDDPQRIPAGGEFGSFHAVAREREGQVEVIVVQLLPDPVRQVLVVTGVRLTQLT